MGYQLSFPGFIPDNAKGPATGPVKRADWSAALPSRADIRAQFEESYGGKRRSLTAARGPGVHFEKGREPSGVSLRRPPQPKSPLVPPRLLGPSVVTVAEGARHSVADDGVGVLVGVVAAVDEAEHVASSDGESAKDAAVGSDVV